MIPTVAQTTHSAVQAPALPPDMYSHIVSLVDHLSPAERLQLASYLVNTVQPFIADPLDDEDEEDDEEFIADVMHVLENTPDDAWIPLDEFEAEMDRAEAAGELPR